MSAELTAIAHGSKELDCQKSCDIRAFPQFPWGEKSGRKDRILLKPKRRAMWNHGRRPTCALIIARMQSNRPAGISVALISIPSHRSFFTWVKTLHAKSQFAAMIFYTHLILYRWHSAGSEPLLGACGLAREPSESTVWARTVGLVDNVLLFSRCFSLRKTRYVGLKEGKFCDKARKSCPEANFVTPLWLFCFCEFGSESMEI